MDRHEDSAEGAPPWRLHGEAVAALARMPAEAAERLPDGVDALPGPSLVLAVRWDRTPMGPYHELTIGSPARIGIRLGLVITTMVVDSSTSCRAGRANWGLPKELGSLAWRPAGPEAELRWQERGIEVRARPVGPSDRRPTLPVWLPIRLLQRRLDGTVVVPGRVRARARPALVEVAAPDGDPLALLGGRHPGVLLPSVELWLGAGRRT